MLQVIKQNPQKYPLDEIVFCDVRFSKDLSGNFEPMRAFIEGTIDRVRKDFGVPVTVVGSDIPFIDYFYSVKQKGKAAAAEGICS